MAYTPSTQAFIPELWAATILRNLENNLVAKQICYTQYTGEIKKLGDTVHFTSMADPAVKAYEGTISYEALASTDIPLICDQGNYIAFDVEDIEAAQANVALQTSQTARGSYRLRDKCDKYILGLHADASNTLAKTVTAANAFEAIAEISQKLDEANVPKEQKWIVIPPWMKTKLLLAGIQFGVKQGSHSATGLEWTKELGFDLYVSNNVVNTGTASAPVSKVLGGSNSAIALADSITEMRALDRESKFAIGVSGLHVFGAKVIKPEELVCATLTYKAEGTTV